jgi:Spy/CpxP family protein refolding chaperone
MRPRWKGVAVAFLATVVLASSAAAQGRGGRGFGGGGFGGGMMLLRMPEVQTELKLTDEQKTKLTEMLGQQRRGGRGGGGQFGGQSREERQRQLAERRAEQQKQLAAILNADQLKRYRQLELQQQGPAALQETAVQDELKLTQDQKTKVEAILSEQRDAMRDLRQSGAGDREAMRSKTAELRKKTSEKLEAVLTEEQKTQWKAMLGAPFTFPIAPARRLNDAAAA